jgi:DeoR family transcriptional regulator, aga operon transcriptional repressor
MTLTIAERHQHILSSLKTRGYVSVSELSHELKVSTVTIRKDLKLLEDRRLLFRTHGSAAPQDPYIADRHVNEKEKIQVEQKQTIAQRALSLIEPNDSIILASGTTINELGRQMTTLSGLTIISSSLIASQHLSLNQQSEVIQLGGMLRNSSSSVVGPHAEKMLEGFHSSKLFLGVDGIDPGYGLTTTNALEASLNQAMIKAAQKIIVLADATKFGRRGFGRICGLEDVDMIITDSGAPAHLIAQCTEKGVEVVVV